MLVIGKINYLSIEPNNVAFVAGGPLHKFEKERNHVDHGTDY